MKILSLDGGGSWALIEARCLLDLYGDITGHEVLRKFDMVITNSGGSMVLACLIKDLKLSEICNWYLNINIRQSIFSKLGFFDKTIVEDIASCAKIGPRYKTVDKLKGLRDNLVKTGGKKMSELPEYIGKPSLQLIICSFDYERNREVFFRSYKQSMADSYYYDRMVHHNPDGRFSEVTLAEAVHGSSNAPVNYFNKPALIRYQGENFDRQFWDGAVGGYNNPVFAGVTEAVANGRRLDEIRVLSIGTASDLLPLYNEQHTPPEVNEFLYQLAKSKLTNDIKKLATAILADPPDSASFHAYTMVHGGLPDKSKRFFRFSPLIKPHYNKAVKRWEIPTSFTAAEFKQLINMDMDAVEQQEVLLIDKLCTQWMSAEGQIDNQAIRCNSMLEPIIGYGRYGDAKAAFEAHFDDDVVA